MISPIQPVAEYRRESLHSIILPEEKTKFNKIENCGVIISEFLEKIFCEYGKFVGKYPIRCIIVCCIVASVCSIGLVNFRMEGRPFKLWIPEHSEFIEALEWQEKEFPKKFRMHNVMYECENVLVPHVVQAMLETHLVVQKTTADENITWNNVCAKIPSISKNIFSYEKETANNFMNDDHRNMKKYSFSEACFMDNNLDYVCMEYSILDIWNYNESKIHSLTEEDILFDVNKIANNKSLRTQHMLLKYLGGIEKDVNGTILSAKASMQVWFTKAETHLEVSNEFVLDHLLGFGVEKTVMNWETSFIKDIFQVKQNINDITIHFRASRSFHDVSNKAMNDDLAQMVFGFVLVVVFTSLILGKFDVIEMRPILSLLGITSLILIIVASFGITAMFEVTYGPINNVIPFFLLFLSNNFMFSVVHAWNTLDMKSTGLPFVEKVGEMMKHCGVSITITTMTELVAFIIGGVSELPAVQSFCIYASVGIIFFFFFQTTYFIAWFVLDQLRIEDHRNSIFWCWKMSNYKLNSCNQTHFTETFLGTYYAQFLLKLPIKIFIVIANLFFLALSLWGLISLQQRFDYNSFLPDSSYVSIFLKKQRYYFPITGEEGKIYFGNISLYNEIEKLEYLVTHLKNDFYINEVDDWYTEFKFFLKEKNYLYSPSNQTWASFNETEGSFNEVLIDFLFSPLGAKYRIKNFKFAEIPDCSNKSPLIIASSVEYMHKHLTETEDKSKAMENVRHIIKTANFSEHAYALAKAYSVWELDMIAKKDLYQHKGLVLLVVFIVIVFLISSLTTSVLVVMSVMITLVYIGAIMHCWNLTIDTIFSVHLSVAVGICIDYAAHIGHTFMTIPGTKNFRVKETLRRTGPSILHGGISTLLAFILLFNSQSHVYKSFFKIYFGVCVCGMYNALILLPVILSFIGPNISHHRSNFSESETNIPQNRKLSIETISQNIFLTDTPRKTGSKLGLNDTVSTPNHNEFSKMKSSLTNLAVHRLTPIEDE